MDDAVADEPWVRRWRHESWRIAAALVALVIAALAATDPPATTEVEIFRLVNDLATWWGWVVWLLMQAGAILVAVPAAAVALAVLVRHVRPPLTWVVGAVIATLIAGGLVGRVVERGRPGEVLPAVNLGYEIPTTGQGLPSSHTAIALAAAVVLSPYVVRWVRWTLYVAAGGVGVATVYMGANFPLDAVAGAALGLVIGSAVNLVSGIRRDRARTEALPG